MIPDVQPGVDRNKPPLRLILSLPDLRQMHKVGRGEISDATYIIQQHIAKGMTQRGHRVHLFGPYGEEPAVHGDYPGDLTRVPRNWSESLVFRAASSASWRCQRRAGVPYLNVFSNARLLDSCLRCFPGHDVVYERNALYRSAAARACKWLGIPYVLYFEADDILEHDVMGAPLRGMLRWRARQTARYNLTSADRVVCVSEQLRTHLIEKWSVPAGKVVVFPNSADTHAFAPNEDSRATVRAALGIGARPLIVFVGAFYVWHATATLIHAFAQVRKSHPDAFLVLVGDGAQREAMVDEAQRCGIMDSAKFTGMVPHDEIPRWLAAADIGVVPYPVLQHEVWLSPLKLFEYMASGIAIVASGVGQIPSILRNGETGLITDPGSVDSVVRALLRFLGDRQLRLRCGERARAEAVANYSWENYCARLEDLLREAVRRAGP